MWWRSQRLYRGARDYMVFKVTLVSALSSAQAEQKAYQAKICTNDSLVVEES